MIRGTAAQHTNPVNQAGHDLDRIFDRSRDLYCVLGADGVLRRVNGAFERTLGWTVDEVAGRPLLEYVEPADTGVVARALERVAAGSTEDGFEVRLRASDGRFRWVEWAATLVHEDGLVYAVGRDVTDRRAQEEERRTSEMRFRAAVEGGFDAFLVLEAEAGGGDVLFRIVDVNSRAASLLGLAKEELLGRRFDELGFAADRAEFFLDRFRRVYESGVPLQEEYVTQRGDERWLEYQIVPLLEGVAVTARDITARRSAELSQSTQARALHQSEQRFLSVVQAVPGAFYTVVPCEDEEGEMRLDFVSENIVTFTGHPAGDFVGPDRITIESLLFEEDRAVLRDAEARAQFGEPYAVDVRLRHADGSVRWTHVRGQPLLDAAGRACGSGGVMLDMTDRHLAEEALQESEALLRAVLANVPGVFFRAALEDGAWRVVYASDRAHELLGVEPESLQDGVTFGTLVHPDDRPLLEAAEARLAEGEPYELDFRVVVRGEPRWMREVCQPETEADGRVVASSGFLFDITERKADEGALRRLEEQLRQAQKMEAVGRLAGGVAHDFNNVLLVIRGYSHVLMSMFGEGGEGWAEAKEIETAATRASELVRQLLAFSRSQVMQTQIVDLNEVVGSTQNLFQPLIGEDVELHTSLDVRLAPVKADVSQLEQAIVNLAVNARDAMPHGGTLLISTRNVAVDIHTPEAPSLPPGTYTALVVEDTGVGMDEETKARVFEPFFTTKGGRGSGLGLSTAYGIVKQSGGDITVVSAPGEGTTMTIYLPQAREAFAEAAPVAPELEDAAEAETVLLVEDDDRARALVGRLLRESGYTVHEAGLPEDALRFCDEHDGHIDLLLSDVVMPQMSGPTLAKHIIERRPGMPVLFVSGYIGRADDVDIVSSGADFLQKPFTPHELVQTVRRVLDRHAPLVA
jgi:two-component system, cell cycle sensor histidine kinase and response regulator CckA